MRRSIAIPWPLAVYLIGDLIVVAFWSAYLIFVSRQKISPEVQRIVLKKTRPETNREGRLG